MNMEMYTSEVLLAHTNQVPDKYTDRNSLYKFCILDYSCEFQNVKIERRILGVCLR